MTTPMVNECPDCDPNNPGYLEVTGDDYPECPNNCEEWEVKTTLLPAYRYLHSVLDPNPPKDLILSEPCSCECHSYPMEPEPCSTCNQEAPCSET